MPRQTTTQTLLLAAFTLWLGICNSSAFAQQVNARISTRETYVGEPIVFQIQMVNAKDYSLPETFEIDGCEVKLAGTPKRSSQILIINDRRSESSSVTAKFLVTPKREGRFTIPELEIEVDGRTKVTTPVRFVASRSETGDLMFAKVIGKKKQVYVGQPLNLTLQLWIKPFQDRENRVELTESQMWSLISARTNWGPFADQMKTLAENRQRPRGESVLREDGTGKKQRYVQFEIDATVYPTKPGAIDTDDIRIVVDYPVALDTARSPFDSMLEDSGFGGSSLMKQMLDDDFFGGSPFGRRLSISKTRPIVAEVSADSTQVIPVPLAGKPENYRGAIGRYQILTQTDSNSVNAGDPIMLRIGIIGDGPMELVQAPPLREIDTLNRAFKITDQSLAGFVQDDMKVFVTTIRPRNSDVDEIPAIPFSFFDPDKERYETVYSKPIPITVNRAETLSMDAIVGGRSKANSSSEEAKTNTIADQIDFSLHDTASILAGRSQASNRYWYLAAIIPAALWLVALVVQLFRRFTSLAPRFRSTYSNARSQLKRADTAAEVVEALVQVIRSETKTTLSTPQQAVGQLRLLSANPVANKVEAFFDQLLSNGHECLTHSPNDSLESVRSTALELANEIIKSLRQSKRHHVRTRAKRNNRRTSPITLLLLLLVTGSLHAQTEKPLVPNKLTESQLEDILKQAEKIYHQGVKFESSDQAEANVAFSIAAQKFATVAEYIPSSKIYVNLGNAQWRSNQRGLAIANYHRALLFDDQCVQARNNLSFAMKQIGEKQTEEPVDEFLTIESLFALPQLIIKSIGRSVLIWTFSIASVFFWSLLILRTVGVKIALLRWVWAPLTISLAAGLILFAQEPSMKPYVVSTADELSLRGGDGSEFEIVAKISPAMGKQLEIVDQRDGWLKIASRLEKETVGWVEQSQLEIIGR